MEHCKILANTIAETWEHRTQASSLVIIKTTRDKTESERTGNCVAGQS